MTWLLRKRAGQREKFRQRATYNTRPVLASATIRIAERRKRSTLGRTIIAMTLGFWQLLLSQPRRSWPRLKLRRMLPGTIPPSWQLRQRPRWKRRHTMQKRWLLLARRRLSKRRLLPLPSTRQMSERRRHTRKPQQQRRRLRQRQQRKWKQLHRARGKQRQQRRRTLRLRLLTRIQTSRHKHAKPFSSVFLSQRPRQRKPKKRHAKL